MAFTEAFKQVLSEYLSSDEQSVAEKQELEAQLEVVAKALDDVAERHISKRLKAVKSEVKPVRSEVKPVKTASGGAKKVTSFSQWVRLYCAIGSSRDDKYAIALREEVVTVTLRPQDATKLPKQKAIIDALYDELAGKEITLQKLRDLIHEQNQNSMSGTSIIVNLISDERSKDLLDKYYADLEK